MDGRLTKAKDALLSIQMESGDSEREAAMIQDGYCFA